MNRTGRVEGHWTEYEETPYCHGKGYFWLRTDGLRFGYRIAGSYYKPGTTPQPPDPPYHPFDYSSGHPKFEALAHLVPAGSYADGAVAFDFFGSERERCKKEDLPAHLRVMKDGKEIELISKINGVDLEIMLGKDDFDPFAFIDERFPIDRTVDAKTKEKKKVKKK